MLKKTHFFFNLLEATCKQSICKILHVAFLPCVRSCIADAKTHLRGSNSFSQVFVRQVHKP